MPFRPPLVLGSVSYLRPQPDEEFYGWENTEQVAVQTARGIVMKLAEGKDCCAFFSAGLASDRLKKLNAAKRAAQPAADTKYSKRVEHLYGHTHGDSDGRPVRFRIVKKTAKRIYYVAKEEYIDEHDIPIDFGNIVDTTPETIGYVDRQKLEADGEVDNRGRHWCRPDSYLYASLDGLLRSRSRYDEQEPQLDLAGLKAAMAAAHPDRGGTSEAFIEARARYVAARRAARQGAA